MKDEGKSKSNLDFINKIEGALQELDETCYWLELIAEANILPPDRLADLINETGQRIAIFVTIDKKVKISN